MIIHAWDDEGGIALGGSEDDFANDRGRLEGLLVKDADERRALKEDAFSGPPRRRAEWRREGEAVGSGDCHGPIKVAPATRR